MAYQVLARKWRPQTFSELVGQQHVVDAITNALENDKLHHAYLFTGTRGVGKTTIARIFSKSLNCEKGQSANPCGVCDTCVDISDGRYVDLLEIDAASRTKVEDTRELLDNVQYRPTRGKYKVYLIDEVHMLSKHSFNALLKTLEEPPEHVKFLLATTDPQKLPVTILSRCLQFNLKALSQEQIQAHLSKILNQENIVFEQAALTQLAKAAQGSIRDSLSLTDQAIAQGNNKVSVQVVSNMLGLLNKNQILKLLKHICERDGQQAIEQLNEICADSPDYAQVLSQLTALLHQIALTQVVPEVCKLEGESAKGIYTLAKTLSKEHIQVLYQVGVNGKRDLPYAPDARSGLQMTVLRMLAFSPAQEIPLDVESLVLEDSHDSTLPAFESLPKHDSKPEQQLGSLQSKQPSTKHSALSAHEENTESTESMSVVEPLESGSKGSSIQATVDQSDTGSTDASQSNEPPSEQAQTPVTEDQPPPVHEQAYETDMFGDPIPSESIDPDTSFPTSDFDQVPSHEADPQATGSDSNKDTLSEIERTRQLLALSKTLSEESDNTGEGNNGKKPEAVSESVVEPIDDTQFALGHIFEAYTGDYPAFLANGDKLISAAQIDEFSAFVDGSKLQALSRQLLLHANCAKLSNPLEINIQKQYENLCEEEIVQNVQEVLSQQFAQQMTVNIEFNDTQNTPFQIQTRINDMRLNYARELVNTDNNIQELIKAFDASLIEDSVEIR